ncbi:MAG: helix-turn-helix domain-containing protein [Lachnospiraceae bacterium]|nr:helix-turn-helix domain-containing protein [Lachnospiraceae bacterium]
MTQGERLKEVRKSIGLTLEKFGNRIGVGKTAISKLEHDQCSITDQMRKSICREYNVNEEWLLNGTGEMFSEVDREDQIMRWAASVLKEDSSSFRKRFVAMLSSLREEDWIWLEEKARMLIDLRDHSADD